MAQTDPATAADFYQNRAAYVAEIEALDAEIREILAGLPADRRTVVASHDALQYFGRDYGLAFVAPQGLSTESEASAKDVARLIQQIREQSIDAVIVENIGDPRLMRRIADETGAVIGGTLYSDALSGPDGKYIVTAMQENELHGWRVSDGADMRMSGYPTKVKSMSWLPKGRYLATGGAESVVCWPFHGKGGLHGQGAARPRVGLRGCGDGGGCPPPA